VTRLSVTAWLGLAGVVAISPIASATNTPTPPGGRQAAFGRSLAIAGDFAFVGEPGGFNRPGNPVSGGSVWIFRRGTPAVWRHNATLSLPAETPSAGFGAALAAEGTVLLVGHVPPGGFGLTELGISKVVNRLLANAFWPIFIRLLGITTRVICWLS
jgi:hypothetical protein